MSLQSNKCLRFFRKYILYNTKISLVPKIRIFLHLFLFHEVNQIAFFKLLFSFGFHPESCASQGMMWVINTGIPSWRKLTPPAAALGPFQHHCPWTPLQVWLPHSAPVTAAQRGLGPHSRKKPKLPFFLGQERCRGLVGIKFMNLERHESSQSSARITMSSGSTGEDP